MPCNSLEAETDSLIIKKFHAGSGAKTPYKVGSGAEKKSFRIHNTAEHSITQRGVKSELAYLASWKTILSLVISVSGLVPPVFTIFLILSWTEASCSWYHSSALQYTGALSLLSLVIQLNSFFLICRPSNLLCPCAGFDKD